MKTCSELRHLEQFGIKILTGEADALGYRILCDLDEQGVRVFKECFGMPHCTNDADEPPNNGLAENWNSGSIASVMLTGYELVPLAIMGFYLQGYDVIVSRHKDGYELVFALEDREDVALNDKGDGYDFLHDISTVDRWRWPTTTQGKIIKIIRQRKSDGQRVQGTRNVHQMTGRAS
jgi:hypothetical protein